MPLAVRCGHPCRMSDYRRMWVPGGTYFFTVNLADRSRLLLLERIDALRTSVHEVRRDHPFQTVAWVVRKTERGIWQRRYWEHLIRDERDLHNHIDYIHINPVKHSLVTRVADWPHSSFHRFVREGVLPADWSGESTDRVMAHEAEK